MDSSYSPPSPTRPKADSFIADDADYSHQESNPHSFSAVIGDQFVSKSETQLHDQKTIEPPADITTAPGLTDAAPNKGHSYYENSNSDVSQDSDHRPLSVEDFAGEKGKSDYNDVTEYEYVKTPTEGDVRKVGHSYEYDEDEYQMNSPPKSYNSDHFGKFKW